METYEVFCPSPHQFQQPSMLFHDVYNDSNIHVRAAENRFSYQYQYLDESEEEASTSMNEDHDDDSTRILKGFLKELDVKGHEMFKKLVFKVEKDVPIDRVLREKLHKFKGKHGSHMLEKIARKLNRGEGEGEGEDFMSTERGVDGDISEEELKLERFKVKTVNVVGSGVVKEEGK